MLNDMDVSFERILIRLRNGGRTTLEVRGTPNDRGLIVLVHAMSEDLAVPRNNAMGERLTKAGFATCLASLRVDTDQRRGFNILSRDVKERRLQQVLEQLISEAGLSNVPIGLFGVGPLGTACLVTAARMGKRVGAVVAVSSNPGEVQSEIGKIEAPTLLVVPSWNAELHNSVSHSKKLFTCPVAVELSMGDINFANQAHWPKLFDVVERWFEEHLAKKQGVGR